MNSINFYHLSKTNTYLALCKLLEKAVDQGNKVLVRTHSEVVTEEIDEVLWSYDPTSFLPHGKVVDHNNRVCPINIGSGNMNPNNASYLFIVSTTNFSIEEILQFRITFVLFNDHDKEFISNARKLWVETGGFDIKRKYWIEDKNGWTLKKSD